MIYLAEFILVGPVTIAWAYWHDWLIDHTRPILHGAWALLYAALVALVILWQWDALPRVGQIAAFALACACGRWALFNVVLNRVRGLPWSYLGTKAWTDRIERRLFGARVWLAEVVLGVIFIFLQFFLR